MDKKLTTKLAIFDIDGTIFRSSLVIELINGLVEAKVFPPAAKKEMEEDYLAWLDRKGSYENYINRVVKIYVKYIPGKTFKKVAKIAQKVIAFHKDRVYRWSRDFIKVLKRQKYFLVAISGSPSYIVERYAKAIGFDLFFGSQLVVSKGKFTQKVLNTDSAFHKAKVVKSLLAKYPSIVLKQSLAVGDTESDIAMLSLVGRPIAFNPNLALAKHAKARGWEIVVERKDVVYNISDFQFLLSN